MAEKIKSLLKNKIFIIGAASFLLPMLALYIIFALNGVHPFGDKQILVTDLWHQYYPFLCVLQEKLKTGASLLYSEGIGMGVNFLALIAYYCASPLNILTIFVSKANLRDLLAVIVALKIGFSGLFCSLYLKKVVGRYDFSTVAFSSVYALCGYALGYYWNIMWLDTVAMLPLVMLGVYSLIKENKVTLYIVSLALSVIFNYYIGFMVCIFTAIYFFMQCVIQKVGFKKFWKKLIIIAACSLVALAITAFITIPAYNALSHTVSSVPKAAAVKTFGERIVAAVEEFGEDIPGIIGRLATFNEPVPKDGLPNIFSGIITIMLLGFFLSARKIPVREKIATSLTIAVLIISMTLKDIDIIWHGMHKPNMVPYRYAFILSFVLVTMAYRAYCAVFDDTEGAKRRLPIGLMIGTILAIGVTACAFKEAVIATILGGTALIIVYVVVMQSYFAEKKTEKKLLWQKVLCGLIVIEVVINTIIAVPTVRTTVYSTYYYRGEEIERLLDRVDADKSYGRVETSQDYILNDPALYGYNGVSTFTSTANYNVTQFIDKLGLCAPARANRYYYETTSPLTNAFLSVERVIYRNSTKNLNPYLELEATEMTDDGKYEINIYKNTVHLPLGFMTEEALLEGFDGANDFDVQNDLFRKSTGLEADLFVRVPLLNVPSTNTVSVTGSADGKYTLKLDEGATEKSLKINYEVPDGNSVYAYINSAAVEKVKINGASYKATSKRSYIFPAGKYSAGEKITFEFELNSEFPKKNSLEFHVYSLNEELFEKGMAVLNDEPMNVTKRKSTRIEADVTAKEDGLLYTSIPYEAGWTLYVDGNKTEITPVENAMIAVKLNKGEHSLVFTYSPEGFKIGVLISLAGLILLGLIVVTGRKRRNG